MFYSEEWLSDVAILKKTFLLKKIIYFCIALFFALSFFALLFFNATGGWYFYASGELQNISLWQSLGTKLAEIWLYWLGGASYLATFGLTLFWLPKVWKDSWSFSYDRFVSFIVLIGASAAMCHLYGVGGYGTLPGGGALGQWLILGIGAGVPKFVWPAVLQGTMWAALVVYTRLCFIGQVHYLVKGCSYVLQPVVHKVATKVSWEWLHKIIKKPAVLNANSNLQKSVLEHEYAEVLEEGEGLIHKDLFWQNYNAGTVVKDREEKFEFESSEEQKPLNNYGSQKARSAIKLPTLDPVPDSDLRDEQEFQETLDQQGEALVNKLQKFGVSGKVTAVRPGPVITLFEFVPAEDAKISKIIALENDLALALETKSIRIIAPVPGRSVVGFEVANKIRENVSLTDVLLDKSFVKFVDAVKKGKDDGLEYQIPIAVGKDTIGDNVIIDLVKTPHLLVAGSTGSGKSVALNSILVSLLCANSPERLRLILVDPKRLEFARYADIGHLLFPIVTDAKKTLVILRWVVREMEKRYEQMATVGVRNMSDYNEYAKVNPDYESLPYIVIVIDELADLMMTASKDVESLIIRIAQMARAAGIHMIVATQRPSVDVVTGLIKVNFPSRMSFRVASKADSRTILDSNGADTLLGAGDMLLLNSQSASLKRAHGAYVTDGQVNEVVDFILDNYETAYLNLSETQFATEAEGIFSEDELIEDVLDFLKGCDEVSISLLQRKFRIGYNRSARIMDVLESSGYVLTLENSKMRKVIKDRLE